MTNRAEIETIVNQYMEAFNNDAFDGIPFSTDAVMTGPMIPTPIEGASKVRGHLQDISPFVSRLSLLECLIDGNRAVAIFHYETINNKRFEVCQYFRIENGQIAEDRVFYDTAKLIGSSNQ